MGHEHLAPLAALLYLPVGILVLLIGVDQGARRHHRAAQRLLSGYEATTPLVRLALLLIAVTATIHLALVPGHLDEPLTAGLFALDGIFLLFACLAAVLHVRHWREGALALLGLTIAAYAIYLAAGLERPDVLGAVTKSIEAVAMALLVIQAGRESVSSPRGRGTRGPAGREQSPRKQASQEVVG